MSAYICPSKAELSAPPETRCSQCAREFQNSSALSLHLVKSHGQIRSQAHWRLFHRSSDAAPELRFLCPEPSCKYHSNQTVLFFASWRLLKQHHSKVHGRRLYTCSYCELVHFSLERDKRYHEKLCPHRPRPVEPVESPPSKEPAPVSIYLLSLPVQPPKPTPVYRSIAPKPPTRPLVPRRSVAVQAGRGKPKRTVSTGVQCSMNAMEPEPYALYDAHDFVCQTYPSVNDASVMADLSGLDDTDSLSDIILAQAGMATQTDPFEDDGWCSNMETQTFNDYSLTDALTQTSLIDFIESSFVTSQTQT